MASYVLRRLLASLLLLFLVLTLSFFLLHLSPGDPALWIGEMPVPPEVRERLRQLYGLDRPLPEQYWTWMRATASGDLGISISRKEPVADMMLRALPNTAALAVGALVVNFAVALWLGVAAARRRGSRLDDWVRTGSLWLYSFPVFWVSLVAILVFAYWLPVFPAGHTHAVGASSWPSLLRSLDFLYHLALPSLVLGLTLGAGTTRYVRNSLLEVLDQEYLTTARAKGLSEGRVIWVHALRNALSPLLQLFGLSLPMLLNGSLIVEVIFARPGLGRLTYDALLARDYPVILASVTLSAVLVIIGNVVADLLHAWADPRVRRA